VTFETALRGAVLICGGYLALLWLMHWGLLVVGLVEARRRRREREVDDVDVLSDSRFAPGVSILVPAYNESAGLPDAVRSLLAIEYPEFEVIVVNDGSTDDTLERLVDELGLVPVDAAGRDVVETELVLGYYRSPSDRRLLVVDKLNGGKADGLNAALNYSRYRYVCAVDADMVFARGSLARAMREIVRDPEVVGLTSYFENSRDPAASLPDGVHFVGPDTRPLFAFQSFDYLRAFFGTRTGWARLNFMLCAAGAFQIWRRDLVEDLQGWSRSFTCEDIEFTFRVHQVMRQRGNPYRIACLPDCVGVTEGPDSMRKLVSQRERWQRVILETWWANKRMLFNPRYGAVGTLGMPFYLFSEILAPIFEILAVVALIAGAAAGLVDWWEFGVLTLAITFGNSALTTGALLMQDLEGRTYRLSRVVRFFALMPLELFVYRPFMGWARVKGTWRYLRGDKGWHKFERNVRTGTT
jgi:cellulose synthase/poly-beta-1,6-N-acetylglucosamine synthase-like glycosyltransferase